jgi:hypothetical protein
MLPITRLDTEMYRRIVACVNVVASLKMPSLK